MSVGLAEGIATPSSFFIMIPRDGSTLTALTPTAAPSP